ncbi:hypothetical protein M758_1G164200 [Ceratodon purpureus]|uniref:Uncharacterized protein n=1 Tax=Ceratodon purpureus TaxID=3225 RepID=A0A8T0J7Z0_CERPU|nr:hypothetical protein KC19_1G168400 [Ceratodon purpureus]KAG0630239.1 hypothetical protein M758_1G164200 [Ceratodon purpureus]
MLGNSSPGATPFVHHGGSPRYHGSSPLKPEQRLRSVPPAIPGTGLFGSKMDDFTTLGFGGVSTYGSGGAIQGNEWMESLIIGDLQPCESTESSTLPPVMVDSWENDFTLPRDLRVRVSMEGQDAAGIAELQRPALQQEEYELQHRLRTLQEFGHGAAGPSLQEEPSFDASGPTQHTPRKDVSEAEERSTESDYSGGLDKDHSVHLVHLLLECVTQLEKNHHSTLSTLRRLRDLSSPFGDPMQRVAAYFCDALTRRVARETGEVGHSLGRAVEAPHNSFVACQVLNEACPYMKFSHLTANQAILEAVKGCEAIHIVDFGITHGIQWAALLQAFASQPKKLPPPKVKITGIGVANGGSESSSLSLLATGRRLQSFAEHLSVELEFCPVFLVSMSDFTPESVQLNPDEKLIANFMLQLHEMLSDDGSPSIQRLLKSVACLAPTLLTLTEYDAALNGTEFRPRFIDALHFYCALFDSLDATMPRDCQDRLNVENNYFARQIENIVACDGADRTQRHESSEQWSLHMQNAGYTNVSLSHYAHSQAQQLLWQYCDNFRLQKPSGSLALTWQDRSLITVSAWKCQTTS